MAVDPNDVFPAALYSLYDARYGQLSDVTALLAAQQAGGFIAYATKAELDADLAHAANTPGLVMLDTTPANNGYYIKVGASGAGSWSQAAFPYRVGIPVSEYANLTVALGAMSAGNTLIIDADTTLTTSEECPAGVTIQMMQGNIITLDSGQTLTVNGAFEAGLYPCFTGAGLVSFGVGAVTEVYPEWFGAAGNGTADDTAEVNAAIQAAGVVSFNAAATYKVGQVSLKSDLTLRGNGAKITQATAGEDSGQFLGAAVDNVTIDGLEFVGTESTSYGGAIEISGGDNINICNNIFRGHGMGAYVYQSKNVTMTGNKLYQIGVFPEPGGGTAGMWLEYGFGLVVDECSYASITGNHFENDTLYGGHARAHLGAGIQAYFSNNWNITGNTVINSPGQGIVGIGECQGCYPTANVADYIVSHPDTLGRQGVISGNNVQGSSQEGITFFGMRFGVITGNTVFNSGLQGIETWDSADLVVTGNVVDEPETVGSGGLAAINVYDVYNANYIGNNIVQARDCGFFVQLSSYVNIAGNNIGPCDVGGNVEDYIGHGIWLQTSFGSDITTNISGNNFAPAASGKYNIAGGTRALMYAYPHPKLLTQNSVNYASPKTNFEPVDKYIQCAGMAAARYTRIYHISTSAMTILDLTPLRTSSDGDSHLLQVNGVHDSGGNIVFSDLIFVQGATINVISAIDTDNPAARTYSISGTNLQLAMASGVYSVRVGGSTLASGNQYNY